EKHASKGFVLPLVLIFMAVFSVFSITFTQVLINTNRNIREQVDFTKAYYIARSGADIGRQLVASGETSWATFTGSLDSGAFHVSLEENNLIVSDATFNGVAAQARIGFVPGAGAPSFALYVAKELALKGGAFINGDVGISDGNSISGTNNSTIDGSLLFGTGVINEDAFDSTVTGKIEENVGILPPSKPKSPDDPPAVLGDCGEFSFSTNNEISENCKYSSISVSNKDVLTFRTTPGKTLEVVVEDLTNNGKIEVTGDATLILTVRNSCNIDGGIISADSPELFFLHFLDEEDNGFSYTANNPGAGRTFSGHLFIRKGAVKINGGIFFGSVICYGESSGITIEGSARINSFDSGGGGTGSGRFAFVWLR
ncbi:MAG TPA: hypothetical protein P5560_13915, partial [Thermotogota bacterium]|nr:hypothetical protein [Thermotogota bacterium]